MFGKLSSFLFLFKEEKEKERKKSIRMTYLSQSVLVWRSKINRFWRECFFFFSKLIASPTLGNRKASWWSKFLFSRFSFKSNLGLVGLRILDLFVKYNDLALGLLLTGETLTFSRQGARDTSCLQCYSLPNLIWLFVTPWTAAC